MSVGFGPFALVKDSATSVDAHRHVPRVDRCYAASGGKSVRVCVSACRHALVERPRGLEPPHLRASCVRVGFEPFALVRDSVDLR